MEKKKKEELISKIINGKSEEEINELMKEIRKELNLYFNIFLSEKE